MNTTTLRLASEDEWAEAVYDLFPSQENMNANLLDYNSIANPTGNFSDQFNPFASSFITLVMEYKLELDKRYTRNLAFDLFRLASRANVPIKEAIWLQSASFTTDFVGIGIPINNTIHLDELTDPNVMGQSIAMLSSYFISSLKRSTRIFEMTKRTALSLVMGSKTVSERLAAYVFYSFLNSIDLSNAPTDIELVEVKRITEVFLINSPKMLTSLNDLAVHLFVEEEVQNLGGFLDLFVEDTSKEEIFKATFNFDKNLAIAATGLTA